MWHAPHALRAPWTPRGPRLAPQDGSRELNSAHLSRHSCPTTPKGYQLAPQDGAMEPQSGTPLTHFAPHGSAEAPSSPLKTAQGSPGSAYISRAPCHMCPQRPSAGFQDCPTPKGCQDGQRNIATIGGDSRGHLTPEESAIAKYACESPLWGARRDSRSTGSTGMGGGGEGE
eukprot:8772826-Pyramimonas_sp.AAC.1